MLEGQKIHIQPVTLPHHDKVSADEWKMSGGPEGYVRNQGFYLYRNRRLIVHGTWFGLARQTELTKLSRVRIDIPNGLDAAWKIDVKKASAQPPPLVRERLRRIIDNIGGASKRTYIKRGTRLIDDNPLPVWTRTQNKNRISYGLAFDHPVFASFVQTLKPATARKFRDLIDLIITTLPIDALFADISVTPENVMVPALDAESFAEIVKATYFTLRQSGNPSDEIELMMSSAEPFRSRWSEAKEVVESLARKEGCTG